MFADTKLLAFALEKEEYHSVAFLMDSLAAEYLEGEMESSKDVFNKFFKELPREAVDVLKERTVFGAVRKLCYERIFHFENTIFEE